MRPLKVIVDHYLWVRVGGGERVNAELVRGLLNSGHKPIVVTPIGFDPRMYEEWFGIKLPPESLYTLTPRFYPIFGLYQRPLSWFSLVSAIAKERPDCIWVDNDYTRFVDHFGDAKIIQYVHFPTPDYRLEQDYAAKYNRNAFWRMYFEGFMLLSQILGDEAHRNADIICCNSSFIAEECRRLWGRTPRVLYPPVNVEGFYNPKLEGRKKDVVMVGRISREKRYEEAIDALSKMRTKANLHIIGGLIPTKRDYYEYLLKEASRKSIMDRVFFHPNLPLDEMLKMLGRSSVFWHCTHNEHFGIAIVEGMASGLPVVVHRSGGQFMDVTERDRFGLSYATTEELAEKTDSLLTQEGLWRDYHERSLKQCWKFDRTEFTRQALSIIEGFFR